ncbi:4Fe-4S dicluster domain-containing protein [Aeromonas enteropelogenes]|uniref:4Fe-4S dicluster domain-containing protein n=1 Tax=Aeromonas enteropelogenes TaxID=29489 RepID=UPI00398A30B9
MTAMYFPDDINDVPANPGRRELFERVARSARATMAQESQRPINTGRPLGAVEEVLFQRLCNHCGDCISACPQYVLHMTSDGPRMDLSLNHCTLCHQCLNACQTMALNNLGQNDTGWRPQIADNCNARTLGNCDECATICPLGAISVPANSLPIISDECNGCGTCRAGCYIGSLTMIPG